jgi:hypothetical protein
MNPSTAYSFRSGTSYPVPAKIVGSALADIYKRYGEVKAKTVVNEAKQKTHPLHPCFDWNLKRAAEAHWLYQARNLIASVQIRFIKSKNKSIPIRAFINIQKTADGKLTTSYYNKGGTSAYVTIGEVMDNEALRNYNLQMALIELKRWYEKYENLKEISLIWEGIQRVVKKLKKNKHGRNRNNSRPNRIGKGGARKRS